MAHNMVLHVLGTVETGSDFPRDARGVALRWNVSHSDDWVLAEGKGRGAEPRGTRVHTRTNQKM